MISWYMCFNLEIKLKLNSCAIRKERLEQFFTRQPSAFGLGFSGITQSLVFTIIISNNNVNAGIRDMININVKESI